MKETNKQLYKEGEEMGIGKSLFGVWVYIMSDCLLFACLFAAYAVLRSGTAGGPGGEELFSLPFVLVESILLLASSFTFGIVSYVSHKEKGRRAVLVSLFVTFLLGSGFIFMELHEFVKLIAEGNGPDRSAFLSAFFTLLGVHGAHVLAGLIWMLSLFLQLLLKKEEKLPLHRLASLGIFWHFLDIVWIVIFTIVYLMSALY